MTERGAGAVRCNDLFDDAASSINSELKLQKWIPIVDKFEVTNVEPERRWKRMKFAVPRKFLTTGDGTDSFLTLAHRVPRVFGTFWVFACRVVERWSSAAANCTERGQAACLAFPSTEHFNRFCLSRVKCF